MKAKQILIVDEERWYAEAIFQRILAEFNAPIYDYVVNGEDALSCLTSTPYEVVILDLMLPLGESLSLPENEPDLMYGIYILRRIRETNKTLPVVCFTILGEEKIKKQIKELNATYIHKLDDNGFDKLFMELGILERNE